MDELKCRLLIQIPEKVKKTVQNSPWEAKQEYEETVYGTILDVLITKDEWEKIKRAVLEVKTF